jgi:UDPglucose 6-dehydrogenase
MKVTVFGSGYVGLVSAACLADVGNQIVCIDVDERKVERLKAGDVPIYEPGLAPIIQRNLQAGRIEFTTDVARAVAHGLFQFIAVGTPPNEDGSADTRHVLQVARSIAEHMADYRIVVDKSTVPVGTADLVAAEIRRVLDARRRQHVFDVVSNPEFLKEGAAIEDFTKPDRIIVGTDNPRTAELLRVLYEPFNRNRDRMIVMSVRSAELTKYAANAMLAAKISFINELANLAERVGADIEDVRVGIGSDPRIGYEFIYPGAGYGGSCFPKDVKALASMATQLGFEPTLLNAIERVNEVQKRSLYEKIDRHFGGNLRGKTVALWGLSFKPNTDDMREASSRVLMEALWKAGARVRAYDPVAAPEAKRIYGERGDLVLCGSAQEALQGADVLAIVTEWREFRSPDFEALRSTLREPTIFDGRNLYDPAALKALGFRYYAIGRGEMQWSVPARSGAS